LGPIPENWSINKLRYVAKYVVSNVDKVPSETEVPIRLCNYTDVYNNEFVGKTLPFMETTATSSEIDRFSLEPEDILITKDSESWEDIAVPAMVQEKIDNLVCGYHLAIIRSRKGEVSPRFLFRYLQSKQINQHFQIAATGVTRFGLPKNEIGTLVIAIPPASEQYSICNFLDTKTAQIDTLVRKKEELIEKLQEKRSALILRTVTRGLPPEAARPAGLEPHPKMKHSGVPWLGAIPGHWQVKKFGYISRVVRGASPRPAGDTRYFDGDFIPWITVGEVTKDEKVYLTSTETMLTEEGATNSRTIRSHTLVLTNSGATLGVPKILSITGCANDGIVAFEGLREDTNKVFLYYYLRSLTENLRDRIKQGSGQPNLNTDIIKAISVPFPPPAEQAAIAAYLDSETTELDALVAKVEMAVERLHEYRSALITAAVTGKIDVRNYSRD
jgi:type I restriction enzyme S subunit